MLVLLESLMVRTRGSARTAVVGIGVGQQMERQRCAAPSDRSGRPPTRRTIRRMSDDELYDYAQQIWDAVEKGGWDAAVAAARRLADKAVADMTGPVRPAGLD